MDQRTVWWGAWVGACALGGCAAETVGQSQVETRTAAGNTASAAAGFTAAPPIAGTPSTPPPAVMRALPQPPVGGAPPSMPTMPSTPLPTAGGPAAAPPTASTSNDCLPPPAAASTTAQQAWMLVNETRLATGAGCMNYVPELEKAAQSHCDYLAMNRSMQNCGGGHSEVEGCAGFTGATVQAREVAAGYPRNLAYTEVLYSFGDKPAQAIPGWLNTPFHRIPLLDPWTVDMGWGGGPGCDIIDMGRGTKPAPDTTISVFPYDGQVDVPLSFNGLESPAPPEPPSGWPSAYPVSIYAKRLTVTEHVITKDGDTTPIEHMWLDAMAPEVTSGLKGYFTSTAMLYGPPYEAMTKYRVRVVGSHVAGPFTKEWTFTTGAQSTRGMRF